MDRSERREWLIGEVSKWAAEGLIDDRQAQAILSRYEMAHLSPTEPPAELEAEGLREELPVQEAAEIAGIQPAILDEEEVTEADISRTGVLEEEDSEGATPEVEIPEAAISEEREELPTPRYDLSGILPEDGAARLIFVITLLGSILLGVGAILFVASNWNAIPDYVRFLLLFAVTFGTYFLGWRLRFQTKSHPRAGHALLFLASIFVGATIFLTAQIFNVNAEVHWLILLWFLAISPMGYGFNSGPILGLSTFTFVLWVYVYMITGWLVEAFMLYLVMGICFYGIGTINSNSERYSRFTTIYQAVGLFFILASYFYFSVRTPHGFEIAGMDWPFKAFFLLLALGAVGVVLISLVQRDRLKVTWQESLVLALAFLGWAVTLSLNLLWENLTVIEAGHSQLNPEVATPLFFSFNLALFLLSMGAVLIGDRRSEDIFVGLGAVFIGLETINLLSEEAFISCLLTGIILYCLGLSFSAFYGRSRFRVSYQIAGLFIMLATYLCLSFERAYHFEIMEADLPFRVVFLLFPLAATIVTIGVSRMERFRAMRSELFAILLGFLAWIVIGFIALFWMEPEGVLPELNAEMNAILFAIFNLNLVSLSLIAIVIGYRRSIDAFIGLGFSFIGAEILNLFKEELVFAFLLLGILLYALGLIPIISDKLLRFRADYQIIGLFMILAAHFYFSLKRTYYFEIFEADWPIKGIFFLVPLIAAIVIALASRKDMFRAAKYDLIFLLLAFSGWVVVGALAFFWRNPAITVPGGAELTSEVNTVLFIFFNLLLLSLCVSCIAIGYFESTVPFVNLGLIFFVTGVFHLYFTTVYAYLPRSLALIVGGLILLAGGWRLEKVRRSLIEKMDLESEKEEGEETMEEVDTGGEE